MKDYLEIVGVTNNGQLRHTRRKESDGSWQSFFGDIEETIKQELGNFINVEIRPLDETEYVPSIFAKKQYISLIVDGITADGKWIQIKRDRYQDWRFSGTFVHPTKKYRAVSYESVFSQFALYNIEGKNGQLDILRNNKSLFELTQSYIVNMSILPELVDIEHLSLLDCLAVATTGEIIIIRRNFSLSVPKSTETIDIKDSFRLGNNEKVTKVSGTIIGDKTHIVAVSALGNIYHCIYVPGHTIFGNIEGQVGESGTFKDISCAHYGGKLHVVAVTTDGKILHTFRNDDGTWQKFMGDIEQKTGEAGYFVAVSII